MTGDRAISAMTTVIRQAAKAGEPDRYLAALLAPVTVRDDLVTLAAFSAEIGRIGIDVSDPVLGEIRIQWWRDALDATNKWTLSGNPIADAFADVVARHQLSTDDIHGFLDAHVHALYSVSPPDVEALRQELILKDGTAFAFAVQILGVAHDGPSAAMIENAGIAYALARLGLRLPYALARGRMPLPPQWIDGSAAPDPAMLQQAMSCLTAEARPRLRSVLEGWHAGSRQLNTALLPLALVEPYLRVLQKPGHDAAHDAGEVAPLTRAVKIAMAHFRGRL